MVATGNRLAGFASDPVPYLMSSDPVTVDDEMFLEGLRHLMVDLQADLTLGHRLTHKRNEALLLRGSDQRVRTAVNRDIQRGVVAVPPKMLTKERGEVERLQSRPNRWAVDLHLGHRVYAGFFRPIEQITCGSPV